MLRQQIIEWISVTMISWLRDPNAPQETDDWSPRNIRERILRMIPADHVGPKVSKRIANDLTRWMADEDGFIQVRYETNAAARRAVQRVIVEAVDREGAERDDDITNDEYAVTYPKILEWIQMVAADMRGLTREQKRLGCRPKATKELLLKHAMHSIEDALLEVA